MFASVALVFEQNMRLAPSIRQSASPRDLHLCSTNSFLLSAVVAEAIRRDPHTWSDVILGCERNTHIFPGRSSACRTSKQASARRVHPHHPLSKLMGWRYRTHDPRNALRHRDREHRRRNWPHRSLWFQRRRAREPCAAHIFWDPL